MSRSTISSSNLSNSPVSGKREFCLFIEYVNENNVTLPIEFKSYMNNLVIMWRRKYKTIDDYFHIKNDNNNIQNLFNKYNIQDEKMIKLWNNYLSTSLSYRIQRVSFEYPNYYFL